MLFRRAVVTGVLASLVLAGCGAAEKLSPRVALREAAQSTANQKEGTFRLSLVGSESDMNALFNRGAPLTEEDRKGLATFRDSHVTFSTGDDKFGLDVKVGELDHAVEFRVIAGKLYGRADVAGLAKLFSASPDDVQRSVQELASRDGFGFLGAASAGRWIVADFTTLSGLFEDLGKQFLGGDGQSTPTPTADPKAAMGQYKAIKDAIGKALTEDVSVKKLGSDDVGDHYLGTVSSLRAFYAKVRPVLAEQMGQLPFAQGLPPDSAVPDQPASLDVWIKSGRVNRLEVDLAQFSPAPAPGGGRVAVRVDIDRDAPSLTAPSDAVEVDVAGILKGFLGQFAGMLEGIGGGISEYD
jgi:hypothetical protein